MGFLSLFFYSPSSIHYPASGSPKEFRMGVRTGGAGERTWQKALYWYSSSLLCEIVKITTFSCIYCNSIILYFSLKCSYHKEPNSTRQNKNGILQMGGLKTSSIKNKWLGTIFMHVEKLTDWIDDANQILKYLFCIWFNRPFFESAFRDLCQCPACLKKLPETSWKRRNNRNCCWQIWDVTSHLFLNSWTSICRLYHFLETRIAPLEK